VTAIGAAKQLIAGLAKSPGFRTLSQARLEQLAALSALHEVGPQHRIFRSGEPCPGIVVVAGGRVRISKLAPSGKEHLLRVVTAPQSFAEVAVLGDFACPADATTACRSSYVLIPGDAFRQLLDTDHGFCRDLLARLAHRIHDLVGLIEDLVLRDAITRIANNLLARSDPADGRIRLQSTRKDLAIHLNLTPETLSRALRRLDDDGLIRHEGSHLVVADRDGLAELAGGGRRS